MFSSLHLGSGGSWDNSDVKTAKKKHWSAADKTYVANSKPTKPDWMGTVERKGSKQNAVKESAKPTKKLFGLF